MSDVMLLGVLRMPFDTKGDMFLLQLQHRCHEAADRIESDSKQITALQAECERLRKDKRELVEAMEKALFSQTVGELYDVLKAAIAKHRE